MSSDSKSTQSSTATAERPETMAQKQARLIAAIKPGTLMEPSRKLNEYNDENEDYIPRLDPANDQFFDSELYFTLRPTRDIYVKGDPENPHIDFVPVSVAGYRLELDCDMLHEDVPVDHAEMLIAQGTAFDPREQRKRSKRARGTRPEPSHENVRSAGLRQFLTED
jgi:hypothetical protein